MGRGGMGRTLARTVREIWPGTRCESRRRRKKLNVWGRPTPTGPATRAARGTPRPHIAITWTNLLLPWPIAVCIVDFAVDHRRHTWLRMRGLATCALCLLSGYYLRRAPSHRISSHLISAQEGFFCAYRAIRSNCGPSHDTDSCQPEGPGERQGGQR